MNEHEYFGLVDANGKLMNNGLSGVPDGIFATREIAEEFRRRFGKGVWHVAPVKIIVDVAERHRHAA